MTDSRRSVDEAPKIICERAEFFLHFDEATRVADGGFNFQPVADDPGITQQAFNAAPVESCDLVHVERGEGPAVVRALLQHGIPAEPRLRRFERDEFEQHLVVVHRHAPLPIMVVDVIRFAEVNPGTPRC